MGSSDVSESVTRLAVQHKVDSGPPPLVRNTFRDALAASAGSGLMVLVTQPIDTAKVNLQQKSLMRQTSGGIFRSLARSGGPAVLWAGTVPALYMYVTEHAVLFGAWSCLVNYVWPDHERQPGSVSPLLLGLSCGVCCFGSSFFTCPADFLKCRMQVNNTGYSGLSDCFYRTLAQEGWSPFWRNYKTVLLRDGLFFSGYITAHESLCRWKCEQTGCTKKELSFVELFIFGGVAGTAGWLLASPADVINSRRQARFALQGGSDAALKSLPLKCLSTQSALVELRNITRNEGVATLWTGLRFQVMRGFIGYGTFTVGYSLFVDFWNAATSQIILTANAEPTHEDKDKSQNN